MGILTQALQLILSLSILVILHEFGHFFFARIFKTRVEKFYLFFNPWFELFKFQKGDTEYGIGWLPLGGYVKISGMMDESMDKEAMKEPAKPYEFRSKPAWQRLLIMVGGVLVNFILALFIYSMILFTWGKEYISAENATYGYDFHEIMEDLGFQDGDKVLMVDTVKIENSKEIVTKILIDDPRDVTISRNNQELKITIPENFEKQVLAAKVRGLVTLQVPFVIDSLIPNMAAIEAGFQKEDVIIGINGESTPYFHQFNQIKQEHKGEEVAVTFLRNNQEKTIKLTLDDKGMIGVGNKGPDFHFKVSRFEYTFAESFPAGINEGIGQLAFYVKQMKLVFTKEGATQIGGFGAIGSLFPKTWRWDVFWSMTAFISLILAFMNILPIPALDGGHVAFLLYEMVTGKKPGEKFMEYAQITGMVILLALLLFANGNDIYRAITEWLAK